MRVCNVCRKRKAEIPDRNATGRPVKRVCRECHSERLKGDLRRIVGHAP